MSSRSNQLPESPWTRVNVSAWRFAEQETIGSNEPQWLANEDDDDELWLFKRTKQKRDGRNFDDYSEVIAASIAQVFGIAHAEVRLAVRENQEGILSRNLNQPGYSWTTGKTHLLERLNREDDGSSFRQHHSLDNIRASLIGVVAPSVPVSTNSCDAFDVFTGYLLLDTLIGNQDRHEENWAILTSVAEHGGRVLAPSFDHGASLGFNLTEDAIKEKLNDPNGVQGFARKGTTKCFDRKYKLLDLFLEAFSTCSTKGQAHWREQINQVSDDDISSVACGANTKISPDRCKFVHQVLAENLRRIRDAPNFS